ncbi:3-oxoacyl-ACP synthase [Robiginitalea sp. SC105]|uniref:3-oxoacyl-ACP synthase n=1 Tax=Robiginitalea sp. SC105 TaxID=2762332 RepID=UPI001639BD10|nr:3-oxoacyl-ACP synthase [Robiginitalea sp. SC105]MBC2838096.1 3-oxoacyl-ACP synthase [Robiginitalea sp. SC105]
MTGIKQQLYQFCQHYVQERTARLRRQLADLRESLDAEDKNSSGDKHETGRAMIQLEQERLAQALREAERLESDAQRLPRPAIATGPLGPGSLVRCAGQWYYIGIGAGATEVDGTRYFCISPASPAGMQFMGKQPGDSVTLPSGTFRIEAHH